ncbi:hypothetical protein L228DRAFT_240421 [Xylona heveae TC161]|uniref:Uncharacterized protein n=1 Tax=Xylona heveae (strain CBS 132557 / TC161) TaxID=1328760 RepID=A0A165AKQ2_XYLHT|nr:hypothetical protein L228DRAFT_240421 [Xylona heveae TC161]KZF20646.1 hypothetical protein L228DRAFT_240421 [Xylona heveae TC161]
MGEIEDENLTIQRAICTSIPTRNILGLGHESNRAQSSEIESHFPGQNERDHSNASVEEVNKSNNSGRRTSAPTIPSEQSSWNHDTRSVADMLGTRWERHTPKPMVKSAAALRSELMTSSRDVSSPADKRARVVLRTAQMMSEHDRVAARRMRIYREAAERTKSRVGGFGGTYDQADATNVAGVSEVRNNPMQNSYDKSRDPRLK